MGKSDKNTLTPGMCVLFFPLGVMLRLLSLLPLWILYGVSDFLAFIAYRVVRYRRRVVRANLRDCFPELDAKQRLRIEKSFYRSLTDYFVQTVKFLTMSEANLRRHIQFVNTQQVDETLGSGRDIVLYTSHYGNWEWITTMGLWCRTADKACFSHVYHPLEQPWFNRWFLRLRSRYNVSIPMREVYRRLLTWRRDGKSWITGFLSDQKPSNSGKKFTVTFFGRPTPFIGGTEELAAKLNAVVMYVDMEVVKRGYYRATIHKITDNPREMPEGEITRIYAETLEHQICRYPPAYLWSHNRWRLKKSDL